MTSSDRPGAAAPSLAITGLAKRFGTVTAVDGVSLSAYPGEVVAILGPNGAGKSTTIACATGLLAPSAGTVRVLGEDPAHASADTRARVGVMLQDGGLTSGATPRTLLRYGAALYAHPRDPQTLADTLGITAFSSTIVRRLSGGQRQRLSLALALIGSPDVLFLDEPTAGMDAAIRRTTRELIRAEADRGATVILTTHTLDDVDTLADRTVVIAGGRVQADGTPAHVVDSLSTQAASARTFTASAPSSEALSAFDADLQDLAHRHGIEIARAGERDSLESILISLGSAGNAPGEQAVDAQAHEPQAGGTA